MKKNVKLIIAFLVLLILAGLWLQSTVWFRLRLADHYQEHGQEKKAGRMYERVLRKDGADTDNFLTFKPDLDKDTKYTIVKKLADYNYKKDNKDKVIEYYEIMQELKPEKEKDYFLLYYLTDDIERLAKFFLDSDKKQFEQELPDEYLNSSRFKFYIAKELANRKKWEKSIEILKKLKEKFPSLKWFEKSFNHAKNKQVPKEEFFDVAAAWKFNEGEGKVAKDFSGKENDGEIYGAKWVEGVDGYALKFDSSRGDFIDIPKINFGSNFSITFWVKIDDFEISKYPQFLGNESVFSIGTNKKRLIQAIVGNGKKWGEGWVKSKKGVLGKNIWHLIVLTYNGNQLDIYVDEDKVASGQREGYSLEGSFYIGRRKSQNKNYAFNGILDEVFIIDRVLNTSEIKDLLNYYRN